MAWSQSGAVGRPGPPWGRWPPWLRRGLRVAVYLLLLWWMLRWFEHRQVYIPTRELEAHPGALGRPFEELTLLAGDGVRLHAWYFPAPADSPRGAWAVMVCHGNGGNISHRLALAEALLDTGIAVLLFDYRGYGRSQGRPSEEGTYRDAQAAHDWLVARGYEASRILVLGESLGGAVAAHLAAHRPVGGLILLGAFTSIPDIGSELYPWLPVRWLARIRYDTRAYLQQVHVPVLILHSPEDELVRFHHAEANYAAAHPPKWLRPLRGTHNDSLSDTDRIRSGLEELLRRLESGANSATGAG